MTKHEKKSISGRETLSENTAPYFSEVKKKQRAFGSKTYLELAGAVQIHDRAF